MYAKTCATLLAVFIILITLQNAAYLWHGYMLHIPPLLLFCCLAWAMLRKSGPPDARRVFWLLAAIAVACIGMEVALGMYKRKPFDENGVVTLLSFLQLLLACFTSYAIWRVRRPSGAFSLTEKSALWLIIALGFAYLAADEEILLHEGAGHSFHTLLGLPETAWTSRLDDMLVGLYGVIGGAVLWLYRAELRHFPVCVRLLAAGFFWLAVSVVADAASHRPDFFVWLLGPQRGMAAYALGEDADELAKIIGEVFFLTGFSSGLRSARRERPGQGETAAA